MMLNIVVALFQEFVRKTPITVVLVACLSLKSDKAQKAKELYQSDWFKKARTYSEANGDE